MHFQAFGAGLSRRRLIRTLAVGSAASVVVGRPWRSTVVAAITPKALASDVALLRLRVADFAPLQGAFGSVRLGFTATNVLGPMRPFIVTRDSSRYYCVSAECTHAGSLIPPFVAAGKRSICPNHGSRFSLDGRVLAGPATEPLTSYRVEVLEGGILSIELYDFPVYNATIEQVVDGAAARVAVSFQAALNVDYEVLGGTSATGPWEPVSFAISVLGPATLKVVRGLGGPLTAYVERTTDAMFFAVAARVRTV